MSLSWHPHPGRRDSSGIRLHYTPSLRHYDAGIMELGLVYTPIMAVPPKQHAFYLSGYCSSKCTQAVRACVSCAIFGAVFATSFRVGFSGFAVRRNLHICVAAAHPPGGPSGEDGSGEGRQRAGGGAGRPALQRTLPGERGQVPVQTSEKHNRFSADRCFFPAAPVFKSPSESGATLGKKAKLFRRISIFLLVSPSNHQPILFNIPLKSECSSHVQICQRILVKFSLLFSFPT